MAAQKIMDLDIRCINETKDFLGLKEEWNALLDDSILDSVFLRHEWFAAWWDAFGKGNKMLIVVAKDRDNLIGIAPLMFVREKFRGVLVNKIKFMSNEHSSRCDFIIAKGKEDVLKAIVDFIFKQYRDWDMMEFNNIEESSFSVDILRDYVFKNKKLFGVNPGLCSPYIPIGGSWDDFFLKRSSRFRKNIRTKNNRLKKINSVEFKEITDISALDDIFDVSKKSWKSKIGKSLKDCKGANDFFKNFSKVAESMGWLSIWIMSVGGNPVAYEYHLKFRGKIFGLRADYDENYKFLSPGSLLDYYIVKNIFSSTGIKEYDLGGSNDFYKKKWTNSERKHINFLLFNKSLLGVFSYFLEFVAISRLKKMVTPFRIFVQAINNKMKYEGVRGIKKIILKKQESLSDNEVYKKYFKRAC